MKSILSPFTALSLCCCLALALAACGQRGPLYLPEEDGQATAAEIENLEEERKEDNDEEADEETPRA